MFNKLIITLAFISTLSYAQGLFDFFGGGDTNQAPTNNKADLDINTNFRGQNFSKIPREQSTFEIIPYLIFRSSTLDINYSDRAKKTQTTEKALDIGVTLNTSFNYFDNMKLGYLLNFAYETYDFNEDDKEDTTTSKISGEAFKVAPLLFYEFNINNIAIYPSIGYGISSINLSGTNDYNENVNINKFTTFFIYKLEILLERYILTISRQNTEISDDKELDEFQISLGYMISF